MKGSFRSLSAMIITSLLSSSALNAAFNSVDQLYPPSPFVVDVTKSPYNVKADGVTDVTEALQRAMNDNVGRHKVLFFPKGTYLVSQTLTWPKKWAGKENWGKTMLRGQNRDGCIIRLKDGVFSDPDKPKAIMWCGGFGSADWFHNYIENLTFDVGRGNPGATALQFYSNNSGAVRDCRFVAHTDSGAIGLDLAHRDMNGPLLVHRCEVQGFRIGILSGRAVNSQTFEHIILHNQRRLGFENQGQAISIRGLTSDNSVPALQTYGNLTLINANLTGHGPAEKLPAIINYNGGRIFLRDVMTSGYGRALGDVATPDSAAAFRIQGPDKLGSLGPAIGEYCSHPVTSPFPSPSHSLRLPVKETPEIPWDNPKSWANVDDFGADSTGKKDSSEAIQKAMDSGASTVFMPGSYNLRSTVTIGGKVRRVVGLGGMINYGKGLKPDMRLADGESPLLFLEHFANIHGGIKIDTRRTIVLKSVADCDLTFTTNALHGELYFEDVVTHNLNLKQNRLWGRQVNIENQGTHLSNDGSDVWILGYKTERGGTLLETRGGGRSEVLGTFSYTTTAGKLAPMFVNDESSVFASFAEVCFSGDPFAVLIHETRHGEIRTISRGNGYTFPYSGYSKRNEN